MTEIVKSSSKQKFSWKSDLRFLIVLAMCVFFGFSLIFVLFSPASMVSTSWQNAQSVTLNQATFVKNKDSRYSFDKYIISGQNAHSKTITYYASTKPLIDKGKLNGKIISATIGFRFGDDVCGNNMLYFAQSDSNYTKQAYSINNEISSVNSFLQFMHVLGFIAVIGLSSIMLFIIPSLV